MFQECYKKVPVLQGPMNKPRITLKALVQVSSGFQSYGYYLFVVREKTMKGRPEIERVLKNTPTIS